MKYSLKELKDCKVITMNGTEGKVKDILFDEESWIIRYVEADFGTMFSGNRILVPRDRLKDIVQESQTLRTNMTREDLENCPRPEDDKPISRIFEEQLNRHYGTDIYWTRTADVNTYGGTAFGPFYNPPRVTGTTPTIVADATENPYKTSLHSFNEVNGYSIHATDGKLGHVEDIIVDSNTWHIIYFLVDTVNWVPWGKKVLLSIGQIDSINFGDSEARVNLTTDNIKNAPEYKSSRMNDEMFEREFYDYYERSYVR